MPEDMLYEALVVDTRPVIEVEGEQLPMVTELLSSLEMREQLGGLSTCEFVLDNLMDHDGVGLNFAFEFSETNHFAPGTLIRVLTGDAASPTELFRGRISAVSFESADAGQPRLRVMAEDALMPWRMIRRNRTFAAGPLRDIFDALAADTDLAPVITGLNDEVDEQQQLNETDLGFLRRLLDRYDADAQVVAEELHISPRSAVDRGDVTLALGEQLQSIRVTADLADQRVDTRAHGFSVVDGAITDVTAAEAELGPGEGITGSELVAEVFPDASDQLRHVAFQNETEAQALADIAQRRRARRFVIAEGTATGNAAIRVGTALTLEGLGPRFTNTYYTTRTCHRFDQTAGYATDFTAETAFLGRI